MRALALMAATILAATMATGAQVHAQYRPAPPGGSPGGMPGQPTVSPYLGLYGGRNPAINYYGIVRPQLDLRNALQTLQQGLGESGLEDPTAVLPNRGTGHRVYFGNLSHYYYNNPTQAAGARGGVGGLGATSVGSSRNAQAGNQQQFNRASGRVTAAFQPGYTPIPGSGVGFGQPLR